MKAEPRVVNNCIKFKKIAVLWVSALLLWMAFGCVTPQDPSGAKLVSLADAKKVTADFQQQSFTPPPRNVNDILRVLAQEKPEDLDFYQKSLNTADAKPPDTKDAGKLAAFYLNRGNAAQEVGRAKQEIEDLTLAVQYGEKSGFGCLDKAMWNLATAQARGGNFSKGIQTAETLFANLRNEGRRAAYSGIFAWAYVQTGDLGTAEKVLAKGVVAARQTEKWRPGPWRSAMEANLCEGRAAILDATGQLSEAENQYRLAIAAWEPLLKESAWECDTPKSIPRVYNWMAHELGQNLIHQGRLVEAEIQARKALKGALNSHGRYSAHTAMMLNGLTKVLYEQGRYAEAEVLARANLDIHRRIGAPPDSAELANVRSSLADALLAQRQWAAALSQYDGLCHDLKTDTAYYGNFTGGKVNFWLALIKGGRGSEALVHAKTAVEKRKTLYGATHYDAAEAQGVMAMAMAQTGDRQGALAAFAAAVPLLLDRANRSEGTEEAQTARDFRLGLILDAYIDLLARIQGSDLAAGAGIDPMSEAFRLADAARGRTVKRALAASSARAAAKDPALSDLARREQDALVQIAALNGLLANVLSAPAEQQSAEGVKDIRARIDTLRGARIALMKKIAAQFPVYAELVDPQPVSIAQAQASLKPGEALIATYVGENGTCVWAVSHQGRPAFAVAGLDRNAIAGMIHTLRSSLDPQGGTLGSVPAFDLDTANRLYAGLLKPVEPGWKNAKNLIVVAHDSLGYLPFSVLPTRPIQLEAEKEPLFSNYRAVPWLARTHRVTVLPSVASLLPLRRLPPGHGSRKAFTGFGNPLFTPAQETSWRQAPLTAAVSTRGRPLARRGITATQAGAPEKDSAGLSSLIPLPDTADEVVGIAQALKADLNQDVFLGTAATEDQVKAMDLAGVKVIAFATHGLLPGELDGLSQPALALSCPQVSGGKEDGLLTMGEILGLKLSADWVVLSACNTGAGQGDGAEAVSGLGHAFFYAGTRSLLVSNWPVETTSARTLTTEIFKRQAADPGLARAEALNQTMLALIDTLGGYDEQGRMVFSYAHPVFWAPFALVGDGG